MEDYVKIKGFDIYAINSKGDIMNVKRGTPVVASVVSGGYLQVGLYFSGKRRFKYVHCLVAEAFVENPEGKPEVNHKNENKLDNSYCNLEWVTHKENINHGTHNSRMIEKLSKKVLQCDLDGELLKEWNSITSAVKNGFDHSSISCCCNGKLKTHRGYLWKFKK